MEEIAKREEQFEKWEEKKWDAKRRQREDRRINLNLEEEQVLPQAVRRRRGHAGRRRDVGILEDINNKEATEGWREDMSIREVLYRVKYEVRRRTCRWFKFTEAEFEEVLRCTAPWKACGVDSVYSFPIKRCPPIKKAVF